MPNYLRKSTNFKIEAKKILILVYLSMDQVEEGAEKKLTSGVENDASIIKFRK